MRTDMVPWAKPQTGENQRSSTRAGGDLPPVSGPLLWFFHGVAQRRLSRSFRALRVAHPERVLPSRTTPLVVALNHPSWWDPLVGFVLSQQLFPARHFYAPMDEVALQRYRIFRRLGMFPVEMHSARGAAQFLRSAAAVLDRGHILAVTPQGQFTDARVRPAVFRSGLAALLHRRCAQGKSTVVLPLALEYTFWDQRLPEALVNCGNPLHFGRDGDDGSAALPQQTIHTALEEAMERTQDELAALALRRDPAAFTSLLQGRAGSAGFYGWIERFQSVLHGRHRLGDHTSAPSKKPAAASTTAADSHTVSPKR